MKVRNRMYKPTEYNGHWFEAGAGGRSCPCMPCFRIHNCDYWLGNRWVDYFCCITNHHRGCPDELKRPNHIVMISEKARKSKKRIFRICRRCRQRVNLMEVDFISLREYVEKNNERRKP